MFSSFFRMLPWNKRRISSAVSKRRKTPHVKPWVEALESRELLDGGLFAAATGYSLPSFPTIARQADFDVDGNVDIVVVDTDKVHFLYGTAADTFESPVSLSPGGTGTWGAVTGDYDGNGFYDVIVSNYKSGNLRVLLNNGARSFELSSESLSIFEPTDVKTADVNNDGFLDVAATSQGGRYITVWHGNGDRTFGSGQSYDAGVGPRTLTIADVSGDGWKDILVANSWGGGSGSLGVYINDGTGSFDVGVQYSAQKSPQDISVGDLNSDGITDIVMSNGNSSTFSVYFGIGSGIFQDAVHHSADSSYGLAVHDMDDDGKADVVFTNINHGTLEVWFGDGNGSFPEKTKYGVGGSPFAVTLTDANADHYADIFVTNWAGKSVSVLMSQNRPEKIIAPEPVEEIDAEESNADSAEATDAFFTDEAELADSNLNWIENLPLINEQQLTEFQEMANLIADLNNSPILPLATRMAWLTESIPVNRTPSRLLTTEYNGQSTFVYADGAAVHFTSDVTGRDITLLYPHELNEVRDAAISADSTRFATISGSQLAVTNINDSSNILTVQLPDVATTVNWLGDDVLVGTQSQGAFRVSPDGQVTPIFPESTAVKFSADGSIIGVSVDRFLTFYDAATLTQLQKIDLGYNKSSDRWEPYTDHGWAYDAESGYIAYTATARNGYSQIVRTFSLTDGTDSGGITALHAHSLAFTPGGNRLAMVVFNDVLLYERAERGWNQTGKYSYDHPSEMAFSADGSVLFIGDRSGIHAQTVPGAVAEVSDVETQRQQELVEIVVSHAEHALDTAGPVSTSDTSKFVDSLLLRKASLVVAQNVVSLLPSNRLIPELRHSVETVWGQINLRLRELETDINRLESFSSLYVQNEATALDVNRLLREKTQAIDLWNLDSQHETYGHVASNEMVRIVSAGNSTPPSQSQQTVIDRSLNLPSLLTGIDLSQASEMVTAVRFRLTVASESPQIVAYRDGVSIGTIEPDENGVVDVRSEEGITEILIHRASNTTVNLHSLTITTDPIQKTSERLPLSSATNRELALAVAPTDWDTMYVPAYPRIIFVDPNQYTMVEVHGYSKSPSINSVEYFPNSGGGNPHTLPDNFITKLSANRWILHPGVPGQLQVNVDGASIRYLGSNLGYEWEYEQITTAAATIQELMPKGPMRIAVNTLEVYAADGAGDFVHEFVNTRPTQVTQKSHPVGTGAVAFLAVIENTGGESGTATIEFFGAGSTYTNDDMGSPQHSFTVNLEAGGSRILKSWVDVPSGTKTGTVVMRVTYPDGRVEVSPFIGTAFPKEMAFAIVTDSDSPTTEVDQPTINETDNIVAQSETLNFGQRLNTSEHWYQINVLADFLVTSRDTTNYHSTTESNDAVPTHLSSNTSAPSAQPPQMFQFVYPPVQVENLDSHQKNEFSFATIMERNLLAVEPAFHFLTNITEIPAHESFKSLDSFNELASLNRNLKTGSTFLGVLGAANTLTEDIDSPVNWLDAGFQLGVAVAQKGGFQFTLLDLVIRSNPAFQQLLGPQFMPTGTAVEG